MVYDEKTDKILDKSSGQITAYAPNAIMIDDRLLEPIVVKCPKCARTRTYARPTYLGRPDRKYPKDKLCRACRPHPKKV